MGKMLIAPLGVGKGSWGHVARLISEGDWEKVLLISNDWAKENFSLSKEVEWVIVNNRAPFDIIKDAIVENLPEGEVSVSLISGGGKEHMALLAALKQVKRKYEIVVLTGGGTKTY